MFKQLRPIIFILLGVIVLAATLFALHLILKPDEGEIISDPNIPEFRPHLELDELQIPITEDFQYPVGPPAATGYHNLNEFGENNHLGEDWNNLGPCDDDLGDSIYSIGDGYVSEVQDYGGGWGLVVRVIHKVDEQSYVESLYAHLETSAVQEGDMIRTGQQIATMGNADGVYCAHLHLELRSKVGAPIGRGYDSDTSYYLAPTDFIERY